jgi:hypothetical protein
MSIGAAQAEFQRIITAVKSAEEYTIQTASQAWLDAAGVSDEESEQLKRTAEGAASQPGEGLGELRDRLTQVGDFTSNTGNMARQVGARLQKASTVTAKAEQEAIALEQEVTARGNSIPPSPQAAAAFETYLWEKAAQAQGILDTLDQEYAGIMAPEAPTAPRSGGPGGPATGPAAPATEAAPASAQSPAGGAAGAAGGAAGAAPGGAASAAPADHQAANGAAVGSGEYPSSNTMGPEQGDFAGWHRDPTTGHLVDPATGREFDPQTGKWIDPITGKPFGEATEYATRLAGLGGGTGGGLASPVGLGVGGGGGSAGMAGLYGGVLPPSIAHAGPASGQALSQAMNNMNTRAHVANQMMMREAAQGGRPFMPPPAMAGMGAGGAGRGGRGGSGGENRRFTDLTEDPEVWAPRQSAALGVLGA